MTYVDDAIKFLQFLLIFDIFCVVRLSLIGSKMPKVWLWDQANVSVSTNQARTALKYVVHILFLVKSVFAKDFEPVLWETHYRKKKSLSCNFRRHKVLQTLSCETAVLSQMLINIITHTNTVKFCYFSSVISGTNQRNFMKIILN